MPLNGEPANEASVPVALASVTVDGRCRERSPVDLALFGPKSERLIERFQMADEGQLLFARATAEGAAEGIAILQGVAGRAPFRVSLWRQRGGDKIRILAAFSQIDVHQASEPSVTPHIPDVPDPMALALDALVGLAQRLHLGGGGACCDGTSSDLLATAWRLKTLNGARGDGEAPGEVDLARLIRRAVRLAAAAGIEVEARLNPVETVPLVIGCEAALWSLLDHLIIAASATAKAPSVVKVDLAHPFERAGLALSISSAWTHGAIRHDRTARIEAACAIAARHDAVLEAKPMNADGFDARVLFPRHRCLAAP
ncbi:MAG: hypothetical protein AAGD47_01180 [Pseudomonadota bacterium]